AGGGTTTDPSDAFGVDSGTDDTAANDSGVDDTEEPNDGGASSNDARAAMGGASGLSDDSGTDEVVSCDGATLMPGNHNRTLDVDGRMRTFILHVPPGYDGETPTPLVFDFHGSDGTGREEQRFSGMQRVSDAEGFLVAFPDS